MTRRLPPGCVTAHALRSLAERLDQLALAHVRAGGEPAELPCVVEITGAVSASYSTEVIARVRSGSMVFTLRYVPHNGWEFK